MKKKIYINIIILPILFVLISISLVTAYNVHTIKDTGSKQIAKFTDEYIKKEKTIIYNRVHFLINNFKLEKSENYGHIVDNLMVRVDQDIHLINNIYEQYKGKYSDVEIKDIIMSMIKNSKFENDNFYSILDLNTKKIILTQNKNDIGKDISSYKDESGNLIFNDTKNNNFDGKFTLIKSKSEPNILMYSKTFQPYNWIITTSLDKDAINKSIEETILMEFNHFDIEHNPYFFIIKLNNINGGENYGELILHQANPSLTGLKLSEDVEDSNASKYRKAYLKVIRESGEGFVTYDYKKPFTTEDLVKKTSYFYFMKDLNWIVGTGFYFDDLDNQIITMKNKIHTQTVKNVNSAIFIALSLIFISSIIFYLIAIRIKKTISEYSDNLTIVNNSLEKRKNNLQTIFEESTDGILIFNNNGYIKDCNDSIVKILDYESKEDIIGRNFMDISPRIQEDGKRSFIKGNEKFEYCVENKSANFEWLHLSKYNNEIWCDVTITQLELDDEKVIYAVVRDINDKKILEEENKKQNLLLAEASKKSAMGEMIGNIAHQWRQPLNNVNLLIHFLRDNYSNKMFSKKELHETVNEIKVQLEYMSKTIDDFTNFISPNKDIEYFTINDALKKTNQIVHSQYSKKNIEFINSIEDITIHGVENEFIQVLLNIFNNSRDSLENIEGEKLIFIDAKKVNKEVFITIKDNAGGIPKNLISRIFEPYFTTKHKSNGTGIGLYMSESIINKQLNGSLKATNTNFKYKDKQYKGAMFTIKFTI